MNIPEITEITRWTVKPGDRLIVSTAAVISPEQADYIKQRLRAHLRLPGDFPVTIMSDGMEVQVVAEDA